MGLTFRYLHDPLNWKKCPSCEYNLVDTEISKPIQIFCEPGAFHSKLLGQINLETKKIENWKCPNCNSLHSP